MLTLFAHTVHFWAAVVWIGGLSGLTFLSFSVRKERESLLGLYRLLQQFSRIALVSVLVVTASGFLLSLFRLGYLSQLGTTEYGDALLGKVAVFGLALVLVNPLLLAIRAELVAGLIVLILAGVVSTTSPPQILIGSF